jgi:23S rRNA pseudouridine2605 synthase
VRHRDDRRDGQRGPGGPRIPKGRAAGGRSGRGPAPAGPAGPGERLQKVLAELGLGSRREIEVWISGGRVRVNGQVAKLGDRVVDTDRVRVDGKDVRRPGALTGRPRSSPTTSPRGSW